MPALSDFVRKQLDAAVVMFTSSADLEEKIDVRLISSI